MAADFLLAALQDNYGLGELPADDVQTVRGLLSYCKKWTQGAVYPEELNNPCMAMAIQLRDAASKLESDLSDNPDMAEDMRAPIQRTKDAYIAIAEALEELPQFARDENVNDFLDNIDLFEQERQAILDAQEQIELQLGGTIPICPRCGSSGDDADCHACLLTRLYPDPQAIRANPAHDRVQGLYGKVYRAYRRVVSGERSLRVLWNAIELLEEHLEELLDTRKRFTKRLDSGNLVGSRLMEAEVIESLLVATENDVNLALKGVARMKAAEQSLRVHDLSRGWEDIFHAAQAIEVTADRMRRELSDDEEDGYSSSPVPPRDLGDQVSFSRE